MTLLPSQRSSQSELEQDSQLAGILRKSISETHLKNEIFEIFQESTEAPLTYKLTN